MTLRELQQRSADLMRDQAEHEESAEKLIADGSDEAMSKADGHLDEIEKIQRALTETQVDLGAEEARLAKEKAQSDVIHRRATLLANQKSPGLKVTTDPSDRPFASFGEQLQAVYRAGVTGGGADERLFRLQAVSGANEGVNAEGGFLVQTDFATEIFRIAHDMGQLMSRVRHIPVSANSNGLKLPAIDETARTAGSRWGGVQGYWVGEGLPLTSSQPRFRQNVLELNKLGALGYATSELLQDTLAMESVFRQAFAEEITFMTEDAIYNGDGVAKPLGLLSDGNAALVVVTRIGTDEIETSDVIALYSRMPQRNRQNAVWLMNQDIEPQLYTMVLSNQPMFIPAGRISDEPFGRLLGRPVIPIEYAASLGSPGDLMLADLSQYVMIEKGTPNMQASAHVKFIEDEMAFRMTWRLDGQPLWRAALTPATGNNTLSPYVVLS